MANSNLRKIFVICLLVVVIALVTVSFYQRKELGLDGNRLIRGSYSIEIPDDYIDISIIGDQDQNIEEFLGKEERIDLNLEKSEGDYIWLTEVDKNYFDEVTAEELTIEHAIYLFHTPQSAVGDYDALEIEINGNIFIKKGHDFCSLPECDEIIKTEIYSYGIVVDDSTYLLIGNYSSISVEAFERDILGSLKLK